MGKYRFAGMFALSAAIGLVASVSHGQALNPELHALLASHPQIKSRTKALESARQGIEKSFSSFLPVVNLTTDAGLERVDNPSTRSSANGEDWSRSRNVATLSVTQNLYNGQASTSDLRTANLNKSIAEITLEGTRQNTLLEGISSYVEVLRQKRLIELANNNEENIQEQLNLEDERVQRGSGVAVDVLQAKSRLQLAKERRVNFEGAQSNAISTYVQVYNHAPDVETMTDPTPPVDLIPSSLEEAIKIARKENPAATNSTATVSVARERKSAIRAEYLPNVDLKGTANYEKHKNATLGTRRDYSILVEASWDLFTGFSSDASAAQAASDYMASLDNQEYVSRKVQEQVKISWQNLLTARARMGLLENAVNIASEVFVSRQKLREAGQETVLNVLDSESEIYNAQINYTGAAYDERMAVYQLLAAMGRLNGSYLGLETAKK